MYPYLNFLHFSFGTYGLCCVIGGALAVLLALYNCKHSHLNRYDLLEAATFTVVAGVVGAKLLYVLVDWHALVHLFQVHGLHWDTLLDVLQGGFVFYGGFLGGLVAILLYARSQHAHPMRYLMTIAPAIPLAHAFGRVGCFMAGCCYGIPSERYGIAFTQSLGAPNGIRLFPVQLLEAALLLVLAGILQLFYVRSRHRHCATYLYLVLYACLRIFTEQFRYDNAERGFYFGLSTSTWISLALIVSGVTLFLLDWKRHHLQEPPEPPPTKFDLLDAENAEDALYEENTCDAASESAPDDSEHSTTT